MPSYGTTAAGVASKGRSGPRLLRGRCRCPCWKARNTEAERQACEMRLRAERQAGKLLVALLEIAVPQE